MTASRKWIDQGQWDPINGRKIIDLLADAYSSQQAMRALLEDSGISRGRLPNAPNPRLQWRELALELCWAGELRRLLTTVAEEFPALGAEILALDTNSRARVASEFAEGEADSQVDAARAAWGSGALLRLVAALEQIEQLANQSTWAILLNLIEQEVRCEEPSSSLPVVRHADRRLDLIYLARECLRLPGGVRALQAAVVVMFPGSSSASALLTECERVLEQEPGMLNERDRAELLDILDGIALTANADVPSLFIEATEPIPAQATASTMVAAVRHLERRATAVPLLRFLELLANYSDPRHAVEGLRHWIDTHLNLVRMHRRQEVTRLRSAAAGPPASRQVRTCLLVRVEPLEGNTYTVMAWMGQTDSVFGPNCGPEDVVTLAELQEWLRQLIEQHIHGALDPERQPLIEFIMPSSHLNEPIDTLELSDGRRLGVLFQVTVRPLVRPAAGSPLLSDRWRVLAASAGNESPALASMRWLDSTTNSPFSDTTNPSWAWIAVNCPLMAQHTAAIDAVLATGAPVAVWLRGSQTDKARRTVLEGLARGRLVTQFPNAVRRFRENGWKDGSEYRNVVLLWDDPTRPPPQDYPVNAPQTKDIALP